MAHNGKTFQGLPDFVSSPAQREASNRVKSRDHDTSKPHHNLDLLSMVV